MILKELHPVEILLVEDSPTDVLLAKEALEFSKIANNLHTVSDGVEAMAFLRREGKYKDAHPSSASSCSISTCPKRTDGRFWRKSKATTA